MIGDAIFHCHLYSHFHEGMWTLWRIFDRLEDGTGVYPDGTPIERLGGVYNIELQNGASDVPGDYLYRSGSLRWDVESGMWGILRVMNRNIRHRCECICRNIGHWWEEHWYDKYM